jgi:hypothetical protein
MTGAPPANEGRLGWLALNPFFVLELTPDASLRDVERAAQKLAALISVGAASASRYQTPFGPLPRDANRVQSALAALRDPVQRVVHEHFYAMAQDRPTATEAARALDRAIDRLLEHLAWPA